MLAPEDFIPLAEDCGLIVPIGEWVLREACRQARAWQLEGLPPLRVAVNVTATQFRQGNLLDVIRDALVTSGLEPRHLELELTESAVMTNPEESAVDPGKAERDGRARVDRRLRHRLFEHELPAPVPDRQAQDRSHVRQGPDVTRG